MLMIGYSGNYSKVESGYRFFDCSGYFALELQQLFVIACCLLVCCVCVDDRALCSLLVRFDGGGATGDINKDASSKLEKDPSNVS